MIRLYIHKDHFFFFWFFSHIGYYRGLSRVPCAIQQVLTSNLFYIFVPTCLVAQSCPTLRDPMNCSLPGSSVHGISQVRILQWIAISCSRGSSPPRDWTWLFCFALFELPGNPIDINIRAQTITFLDENTWENIHDVRLGTSFLGRKQNYNHKIKMNRLDYIKMKNFCPSKNTIKEINGKPHKENICKIHILLKTYI